MIYLIMEWDNYMGTGAFVPHLYTKSEEEAKAFVDANNPDPRYHSHFTYEEVKHL